MESVFHVIARHGGAPSIERGFWIECGALPSRLQQKWMSVLCPERGNDKRLERIF